MSTSNSHQFSSYNSDTINELNELNDLNSSNISENIHDLDTVSNSSSPDQALPIIEVGYGLILDEIKLKKIYCKVKIKVKDGLNKECSNNYRLTTGIANLKSYLHQVYQILPSEENNNNSQFNKTVSNQSSLHDFINKKSSLPISKQDKITNHVLGWIINNPHLFNATSNKCFCDISLEYKARFEFPCYDIIKEN
ncbi:24123_t:CDS:2 [Gigaspora margarita]|uniref:24123_t:CDS:1 n=1 Tax=Gigaspora margarita TaxID=4874 RepID=A0ABN7U2J6_GIGMA|nr:24123_t:CDS:2 [Gigaspora margarita]